MEGKEEIQAASEEEKELDEGEGKAEENVEELEEVEKEEKEEWAEEEEWEEDESEYTVETFDASFSIALP